MDQLVIDANTRKETGKKVAKQLRESGRIPAVMYDEAGKATSLDVDKAQFNKVWRSITATTLVTLNADGKSYDAFIRDTEYDIKTDTVLHADFLVVSNKKPVVRTFKLHYSGTPVGVLKGGFMVKHIPEIKVKSLPKDMPARVTVDVSPVNIGEALLVKDLDLGKNVSILTNAEEKIISIAPAR